MATISEFFTEQHRSCDRLFEQMEAAVSRADWAQAESLYERLRADTRQHLDNEEQALFPLFEDKTGMRQGPTAVMRGEHQELRDLLQQIGAAVQARDGNELLALTETFFLFLQQHNVKEEQVLYPMAEQALQDSLQELEDRVPGFSSRD